MEDGLRDFKAWYFTKPLITRTYLAICVGFTIAVSLGLLNPLQLFYTFESAIWNLQIWRIFTSFFFMGKFNFGTIFNIYFAFIALNKVETVVFNR